MSIYADRKKRMLNVICKVDEMRFLGKSLEEIGVYLESVKQAPNNPMPPDFDRTILQVVEDVRGF